jgi:adenylate cyclase
VMLMSLVTSRKSTVWALILLLVLTVVYTVGSFFLFEFARHIIPVTAPLAGAFLAFIAVIAFRTVFLEKDKRRTRAIFSKIVDPAVLEQILEHPPELGGQDKELTVFFSDIRNFSSIAEKMTSQELVQYLNKYFTVMTDIIKEYLGTQDKLIGDAVMGFWGAPSEQLDHALLACKCAMKQMEALGPLNEAWRELNQQTIDIGIGISTGSMTAAYMGSKDRLAYTVIGDAVNLGSRLEGLNKAYYDVSQGAGHYSRILISEHTYDLVKDQVIARELDAVRVKGKLQPSVIYELIDVIGGYEPPKPTKAKGKMLDEEAAADRKRHARQTRAEARAKGR